MHLSFALIEVNERLCKFISKRVWTSKAAQKMEFYQKVEYANPTPLMEQQTMLECLEEVNAQIGQNKEEQFRFAWTLDGRKV
jgi:hypothetical protein